MRLCATAQIGPADRQVALSEQQLRGLLAALTQRPAVVVLEVGCGLKLVLAAVIMSEGLPTGDAIDGSESRADRLTTASKTSRRIIRVAASSRAPAARRRFSVTADDKKQAAAVVASVPLEAVRHALLMIASIRPLLARRVVRAIVGRTTSAVWAALKG